ncbi:50S ribosomal protein L13 [Buchnera aphidicola (Ceratovacuna keduensis)]|uniref:50S ribosomal protein L13 n=1 Tax=Buchnera aphidicola TaxID=9 RepID=UPI0031B845BE
MKSFLIKNINKKEWFYVNAKKKILGRLASTVSKYLMGKHKSNYSNNINNGDYIIIFNAEKISVTGKKMKNKIYYRHTGYVGGLKKISLKEMILKNPEKVIINAIRGMLPKNSLRKLIMKKLKVYSGETLRHISQKPKLLKI